MIDKRQTPILLLIVLAACHLLTLTSEPVADDEVAKIYFGIYHNVDPWSAPLPPDKQALVEGLKIDPQIGHAHILGFVGRHISSNLFSLRFAALFSGFCCLLLLIGLARRFNFGAESEMITVGIGCSSLFYMCTHVIRPECFIWLISTFNVGWVLIRSENSVLAILCGFLASISLIVHPAASFFWIAVPALIFFWDGYSVFKVPRYRWWAIGALAGVLLDWHSINLDAIRAQIAVHIAHGQVRAPTILFFHFNVFRIFLFDCYQIGGVLSYLNPLYPVFMAGLLTMTLIAVRQRKVIPKIEFAFVVMGGSLLLAYALFMGSSTPNYLIYILPWLLLPLPLFFRRLRSGELESSASDVFIFNTLAILFILGEYQWTIRSEFRLGEHWILLSILFSQWLIASRYSDRRVVVGSLATMMAVFVSSPRITTLNILWIRFMRSERPGLLTNYALGALLGVIVILYLWRKLSRQKSNALQRNLYLTWCKRGLIGYVALDIALIGGSAYRGRVTENFTLALHRLESEKLILGPMSLWAYDTKLKIESINSLRDAFPNDAEFCAQLSSRGPMLTLWLLADYRLNRTVIAQLSVQGTRVLDEGAIDSPIGLLEKIRFQKTPTDQ